MYSDYQRRGPTGPRGSGGAQRSASGNYARQGANPYQRPHAPHRNSSSAQQEQQQHHPRQQQPAAATSTLSIRGASSIPTQVLVSNLARGTSSEDVRQTFLQFGDIIRVKERVIESQNAQSVAYEVLFEEKRGAIKAGEQLHGALADGRILTVVIEEDKTTVTHAPPAVAAPASVASSRPRSDDDMMDVTSSPAPVAPPTGPRSNGKGGAPSHPRGKAAASQQHVAPRELLKPAIVAKKAAAAHVNASGSDPLHMRLLTAKERKAFIAATATHKGGLPAKNGATPTGPKAKQGGAAAAAPGLSLASRIGGLPLAQRLGSVKGGGAKSDLATLEAGKNKKAQQKAAATAAAAQGTSTTASKKKRARANKGAPGAAMDIDG